MERRNPRRGNGEGFGIPSAELSKPTPNIARPQGPRVFVQIGKDEDGHGVALHGFVDGHPVTIGYYTSRDEALASALAWARICGLSVAVVDDGADPAESWGPAQ